MAKVLITCPCGQEFLVKTCLVKRAKYCSNPCKYRFRKRPIGLKYTLVTENKGWFKKNSSPHNKGKARPYLDRSTGYYKISVEGKELKYHRYLMEKKLGRKLNLSEVVHHIDNNPLNNDLLNLELMPSKSAHLLHHWQTTRRKV